MNKNQVSRYHYIIFGLHMESDLEFPECLEAPPQNSCDISIVTGDIPERVPNAYPAPLPHIRQGGEGVLKLIIPNVAQFYIEHGKTIYYQRDPLVSDLELRLYILGSCMAALLMQRGFIVLHGNAISEDGKTCKVFTGDSGAGKSTLAAQYYQKGAHILTDDITAITMTAEGVPIVLPSYPQLKLWEESTTLLNIGTQNLRRARPQDNKYALPIQDQFCRTPLPLSEIIELHRPFIHYQSSHGIQKLSFLRKNTYRYRFIKLMNMETQYRQEMLRIANHIHMKTQVPKD